MKNGIVALVALAGLASGASATNTWVADISYSNPNGRIEQAGDTATVQIWAQFDDNLYAFAGGALNVMTDDNNGSWSNIGRDLKGPGTADGVAAGGNVTGIITGQLHFPLAGIFADTSNPIKAWHGTFTTSDFTTRTVNLSTDSTKYSVYTDEAGTSSDFINSLIEAAGGIQVGVPTPGTAALLGLGALAAGRRRR
jgi:MYXO-CTERM domain-containing protein